MTESCRYNDITVRHSSVKVDCETLLSRFQETDSVRFENFLEIWRDMKFSHIFLGGMQSLQMVNFTKDALAAACLYFLPPYTFQIRVGALYLLYGLYNTQLCRPKEKIRLSLKDWHEIEDYYQDLLTSQHLDAAHIFRQMRVNRAFHFTAMPTFLSYGNQKPSADNLGKEEFKDTTDRVADLVSTDMMEELLNIHEHYQKTKCLISADKSQPDKSLSLIKNEFVDDLKSLMTDHQQWKQEKRKPKTEEEEQQEKGGTSQESEGSERARALARIKSKSYSSATLAIKSRRHRQVELVSSIPASPSHKTKRGQRAKKPKRRKMASKDEETELGGF
uniref:Small nuclear RNA activating complex polypeptide 1 n=1 Tax=Leptobrachium leishanense TaxID=445787 RepID=A0A8C5MT69_9ANUR